MNSKPARRQAPLMSRHSWARQHRRLWIIALVLALAIFGATSCGSEDETTDLGAIATELADTWARGWDERDAEAVGSVFAVDAVYIDDIEGFGNPRTWTREETMADVESRGGFITEVRRVGELTPTDHGTFTWVAEFTTAYDGLRHSGVVEIELDGDLASRIEWLSLETIEL